MLSIVLLFPFRTGKKEKTIVLIQCFLSTDKQYICSKSKSTGNKSYFKEKVYLTLLLMFFSWMLVVFGTKSTVAQIITSSAFFQFVI